MTETFEKPKIFVNRLVEADLRRLVEIERACYPDPWSEKLFVNELSNRPFNCPLAGRPLGDSADRPPVGRRGSDAERALGKPLPLVGFAIAHLLSTEAHILNIAVDPAHQGRGIGRALLYSLLNFAAEHGESRGMLEVRESNSRAQRLYLSAGFEIVGRRKNYYSRQREDALVMALEPLLPVYPRSYWLAEELRTT
jgi:ribosomal-protein-alanine N-acetyltransferase